MMFCPGCGTQNELKQGYCRQCGQALSAVRLAVEGSADQSLEKLKASREWINAGSAVLVIFTLIGLALASIGFSSSNLILTNIALINLFVGLAIGIPLIFLGKAELKGAARFLSQSANEMEPSLLEQARGANNLLTGKLNAIEQGVEIPGSVTEHTTLKLEEPKRADHNRD